MKLIAELSPELAKLGGELSAEDEYLKNLETAPEEEEENQEVNKEEDYTKFELQELEIDDAEEYRRIQNDKEFSSIKAKYQGSPKVSLLIDAEIKRVSKLTGQQLKAYRPKHFEEVLKKEQEKIAKIEDRMFFDDNGEQKFTIEGESEMSPIVVCVKFIEYAKRKLFEFGTKKYYENLYKKVDIKNFEYEVNDLNLPAFAEDGVMAREEINLILEKNKGIKGANLLAALNANNFDFFEHSRDWRNNKDIVIEKQAKKYNFFVDILIGLTGTDKGHKKLEV
jgi:hypothetical protein